jgi:hypothetical protein
MTFRRGLDDAREQLRGFEKVGRRSSIRMAIAVIACATIASVPKVACACADEGGVSFWVPGFFGSLAAAPQQPGWSVTNIYYHTSVSAGGDVALAREFEIKRVPGNLSASVATTFSGSLSATADTGFLMPTYTFATPVFGGQAMVGVAGWYGVVSTSLAGTLAGALTVPR